MVVGKDKKKQFDILKKLMNAPDVSEVVNACDAGREGELLFRSVYELAGCKKMCIRDRDMIAGRISEQNFNTMLEKTQTEQT